MIRVLVTISEAQPELLHEMKSIKARHRAERLRSLAFTGLHSSSHMAANKPLEKEKSVEKAEDKKTNHDINHAMNSALKNMGDLGKS